jgi:hypothetical protein
VIQKDTEAAFQEFLKEFRESQSPYNSWGDYSFGNYSGSDYNSSYGEWGGSHRHDDFFMDGYDDFKGSARGDKSSSSDIDGPIVPSTKYRCQAGWVVIRAEMNYKYLWMHSAETMWMGATATMDTPLHRRAFKVVPVQEDCSEGGWVRLREGDSKSFVMMVAPTGEFAIDEWVVKLGTESLNETYWDTQYHFLLEEEGYLLNKGSMAFVNVMPEAEYSVRGHTGGWDRTKAASREYGAMMHFQYVNESTVQQAIDKEELEISEAEAQDKLYIAQIAAYPKSKEKRVISYGLYGAKEKYTVGAIRNVSALSSYPTSIYFLLSPYLYKQIKNVYLGIRFIFNLLLPIFKYYFKIFMFSSIIFRLRWLKFISPDGSADFMVSVKAQIELELCLFSWFIWHCILLRTYKSCPAFCCCY